MNDSLQTFQVYIVGADSPSQAVEMQATDPLAAAQSFLARSGNIAMDVEIAVISPNGFEDVYGYRSIVPQAHLDD